MITLQEIWDEMWNEPCLINHEPQLRWWRIRLVYTRRFRDDHEGQRIFFKRFGLGYDDFDRDVMVAYLISFNLIILVGHWIYEQIRFKLPQEVDVNLWSKHRRRVYLEGYNDALNGKENKYIKAGENELKSYLEIK